MASENRGSSSDLNEGLLENIKPLLKESGVSFSYAQVIRLLRYFNRHHRKENFDPEDLKFIEIIPKLSLAFAPSDVYKVENGKDNTSFSVTANFLGIYGTSSPMPTFYTEELITEEGDDESVTRDFFKIINQRLYELLFQVWSKYRLFHKIVEDNDARNLNRLYALMGLGNEKLRDSVPESYGLLRYIGLLTHYPRSAAGLETLLKDALLTDQVSILQCVERKASIPDSQRLLLGDSGSFLGKDSYVGEEIVDRNGKFRIQVGPLLRHEFHRFSPGNESYEKLLMLTNMYLTDPMEYDLELILKEGEARTVCLGKPNESNLGITGWIFSEEALGEVRMIFTP